jgi:GNAT superfamily N-acetyltransferase
MIMAAAVLDNGLVVSIRPAHDCAHDRQLLCELFQRVSAESLYFRFFRAVREVDDNIVNQLVRHDGRQSLTLFCVVGNRLVAVGSYDRIDDRCAELSVLVDDSMQDRGIGTLLLRRLTSAARRNGFSRMEARVLCENRKMLHVLSVNGYRRAPGSWGMETTMTLSLTGRSA